LKNRDKHIKWLVILCFGLIINSGFSQQGLEDINLTRVPQKKIRKYINTQVNNHIIKFCDIEPSWKEGQDSSKFRELESTYLIKENPEKVWELYKTVSPAVSWNGKIVSFGLLFSKWTDSVMYRNENKFTEIDTGQVYYVNLRLLKGLYNLAVGLEIIKIDSVKKSIQFSYIEGGKSQGEQTIHFIRTEEGYTQIIHSTLFKSNSRFRDKVLYPHFHRKAIDEFHRNIKNSLLAAGKLSEPVVYR
jgi:hypothetical protein